MKDRILLVSDSWLFRGLLKYKLSKKGFEVETAGNEKEFWEKAFENTSDLILFDKEIQGHAAEEAYESVLNFGFDSEVPVIFLLNVFDFEELVSKIRYLVEKSYLLVPIYRAG